MLHDLDLSQNKSLVYLNFNNNSLESIDLSKNKALIKLFGASNGLRELNIFNLSDLTELYFPDNKLKSIDLSTNSSLESVKCYNNHLTFLLINNGNNQNIKIFDAEKNNYLTCIQVDNQHDATNKKGSYKNWKKNALALYSEHCMVETDIKFKITSK
ncbi:MAG TPA: hypothetical protein EYG92_12050 [Lutibacter sp.]|nr:hypothetical protein [Lutibacter sp.]